MQHIQPIQWSNIVQRETLQRYLAAVGIVALAMLLKIVLNLTILGDSSFLLFFAAVTISAWQGGFGPGMLATLLTALLSWIFFLSPSPMLSVDELSDQISLVLFMIEGCIISGLSGSLWAARRRAERAVRDREDFLAVAAHELKTPLTSLLGYTQLLQRRLQPASEIADRDTRVLRLLGERARRIQRLIDSLLDISRVRAGSFTLDCQTLDIAALTRRVVDDAQSVLEQHAISWEGPDKPCPIDGDELRLEQVFQNLLQNAIKYSPNGGMIRVNVARQDQVACITVCDQGIGIPPSVRNLVFQRYYRTERDRSSPGMGIGLYVVQEIITLHGGTVEVVDTDAPGTSIRVLLPTCQVAAPV